MVVPLGAAALLVACSGSGPLPDAPPDRVVLEAVHDEGAYGLSADLSYRAPAPLQLLSATGHAGGIEARTELYQQGVDDDGPPQQPSLSAGEQVSITAFAVPDCAHDGIGEAPTLTMVTKDASGVRTVQRRIEDPRGLLRTTSRTWCAHGVMAALQTGAGTTGCALSGVFLLRNPRVEPAVVTVAATGFRATAVTVPAQGTATLRLSATSTCGPTEPLAASVRYASGRTETVALDLRV